MDSHATLIIACVLLVAFPSACGVGDVMPLEKTCTLSSDQSDTLIGRRGSYPIPITIMGGDFTADQITALGRAVDTWNVFFQLVYGKRAFDYGSSSFAEYDSTRPSTLDCAGTNPSSLVVLKVTDWDSAFSTPSAIAVTTSCVGASSPYNSLNYGLIQVNYQYFYSSGKQAPDFQAVMVHELGHAMGLDHSCNLVVGTSTFPGCSAPGLSSLYKDAVMYPTAAEGRHLLNRNDEGRMNCLYLGT